MVVAVLSPMMMMEVVVWEQHPLPYLLQHLRQVSSLLQPPVESSTRLLSVLAPGRLLTGCNESGIVKGLLRTVGLLQTVLVWVLLQVLPRVSSL